MTDKYELPEPQVLGAYLAGGTLHGYSADQMQAAHQAGRDSVAYTGELPDFSAVQDWWDNGSDNHELFVSVIQDYARQAIAGYQAKVGQSEHKLQSVTFNSEAVVNGITVPAGSNFKTAPQPTPAAQPVNQVMLEALKKYGTPPGDWACKECRPNSDMLKAGFMCSYHVAIAAAEAQPLEPVKGEPYDKTEMNAFVQDLYDQKMREGKHGHYETMFHVVHKAIERASATGQKAGQ